MGEFLGGIVEAIAGFFVGLSQDLFARGIDKDRNDHTGDAKK